jgi:hypothetical protein
MVIPDWLTPGSPTPFETGLWGIVSALDAMPNMGNVFGGQALAGGMSPVATGSGGTSHTTNINLGGQSMSFSGSDQGEQAIIAMAQILRRQLAGAG